MRKIVQVFFIVFSFTSCSDDDKSTIKSGDPSNMVVEIIIDEGNTGLVEISATADDVVEFEINVGESGVDAVSNTTGIFNHTYSATGVYLIEIKAFGTSGRFLKESNQVSVQVGDATGPIDGEDGYITPLTYEGMNLIWQDEFTGNGLNETEWNYETGTGSNGWGNNELQYYRRENTSVADGYLTIEAKEESFSGRSYTSSRLTTQNKFDFQYGRIDIRAILPKGQGIWPAFWMLGENFNSVGWPYCGEIDIMELIGGGEGRDDKTHGTIHWDNNGSYASTGGNKQLVSGIFNDKFHVWTLIWDSSKITWYLNDEAFYTVDTTPAGLAEFHNNFFLIFNIAVGGNWPGSPNATTIFPQKMIVDYVRVFQND